MFLRKTKTGKYILFGVFYEPDYVEPMCEHGDEMLVGHVTIHAGGLRFRGSNSFKTGIEDILEGEFMSTDSWKQKDNI